jgi:hypothetical protein
VPTVSGPKVYRANPVPFTRKGYGINGLVSTPTRPTLKLVELVDVLVVVLLLVLLVVDVVLLVLVVVVEVVLVVLVVDDVVVVVGVVVLLLVVVVDDDCPANETGATYHGPPFMTRSSPLVCPAAVSPT